MVNNSVVNSLDSASGACPLRIMERCFAKGARNLRVISNSDLKIEHLLYLSQRRLVGVQSPAVLRKKQNKKTHTQERSLILNELGLKSAYIPTKFGFQDIFLDASTGKCCTSHSAKGFAQTNGQPSGLHQH